MNLIPVGHHFPRTVTKIPFKPVTVQLLRDDLHPGSDTIQSRYIESGIGQGMHGHHRRIGIPAGMFIRKIIFQLEITCADRRKQISGKYRTVFQRPMPVQGSAVYQGERLMIDTHFQGIARLYTR